MNIIRFSAVLLTALALVPGMAHLLALPNKIGLDEQDYFIVQQIYRGWAFLGIVLISALIADLVLAISLRGQGRAFRLAVGGVVLVALTLAVFFAWTYPANVATGNWTSVPPNWEALRRQWEYSHALNAIISLLAFGCVAAAALSRPER
ncbi:MAG TPA: DUF1772 domain-containing protein [Pseudorhodoplanes sp.]|nr:DUF1772 domain-containing protein [Pseudorhodoplanes sp.]